MTSIDTTAPSPVATTRGVWSRLPSPFQAVSSLTAVGFALLALYPLSRVLIRLFVDDGEVDLSPMADVWQQPGLVRMLVQTTVVVSVSGVIAIVVGSAMAWLSERTDARLGALTDVIPMLPFVLPPIAGTIGWVLLLSPGAGFVNVLIRDITGSDAATGPLDIYSWWGFIALYTLYMIPFTYLLVSAGLRNLDPQLEEQSRLCGGGRLRTLWRVTIPAVKPSLGGAILLTVWFGFALFSVPVILGTQSDIEVLSVRIVRLLTFTYPAQTAEAVALSVVMLVAVGLAWYLQGRVLKSGHHASVGGRGQRTNIVRLGPWKWAGRLVLVGYVVLAVALPLLALLRVALTGFWTQDFSFGDLNLDAFRNVLFDDIATRGALVNSLRLGGLGATIGIVAAAVISIFLRRSSSVFGRVLDSSIKLPAVIPHFVVAIGMLFAFSGSPFHLAGSFWILLLAYLALFLPQASVAADAAAAQVGRDLVEASSLSGAGGGRTFRRIHLPIMLPGLVAGWALLFVWMLGELNASAILAGTQNRVVGFELMDKFLHGTYAPLAALAIVLTMVSAIAVAAVMIISRKGRGSWTEYRPAA